jgi:hypothetical protein
VHLWISAVGETREQLLRRSLDVTAAVQLIRAVRCSAEGCLRVHHNDELEPRAAISALRVLKPMFASEVVWT